MKNKIILGSANFNQTYGIKKNFIGKSEIKKLLNLASKNGIKTIDTSPFYNNSEKIIIDSINKIIDDLDKGNARVAEKINGKWIWTGKTPKLFT